MTEQPTGASPTGSPASEPPWRRARDTPRPRRVRPSRILLAEDDAAMRSLVAEALRDDGHDVVELTDGGRLLVLVAITARHEHAFGDESIDLIVSDIWMPVCTGLQILEALRATRWNTPVILMTAFGDSVTRARAEALSAILFDKPFDVDDLRTAVNSCLPPA